MSKSVEIKCDACGNDLTRTSNCEAYRLVLANENIASRGGVVTAMAMYPDLNHDHHFCGIRCLDHWTDRRRHYDNLWRAWNDKWKDEHGTKDSNGRVRSYPGASEDVRKACVAEFSAASLVAFPMAMPPKP